MVNDMPLWGYFYQLISYNNKGFETLKKKFNDSRDFKFFVYLKDNDDYILVNLQSKMISISSEELMTSIFNKDSMYFIASNKKIPVNRNITPILIPSNLSEKLINYYKDIYDKTKEIL